MKTTRSYMPHTLEATQLLGLEVARGRRDRRWTLADLAARSGVSVATLRKVERGDPTVGLGTAFEVAVLVGVRLFDVDHGDLGAQVARSEERLAVLPQRIRQTNDQVKDDF